MGRRKVRRLQCVDFWQGPHTGISRVSSFQLKTAYRHGGSSDDCETENGGPVGVGPLPCHLSEICTPASHEHGRRHEVI
jgi:hypothetical protein